MAVKTLVDTDSVQTLTNKTLTAPVIATISNVGTISLPTTTDTLVGRATTDTMTSKTLTNPTINGATLSGTLTGPATVASNVAVPGTLVAGTSCVKNPIAASTQTVQAHGLSAIPTYVNAYLESLSIEGGYSIGDRVYRQQVDSTVGSYGFDIAVDATNVTIIIGNNGCSLMNKVNSSVFTCTPASWKIVAVPYKLV